MKRGILVLFVFAVFLLYLVSVSAASNDTEQTKINNAYSCLQDKTTGKCSSLTTEEKAFTVLATGQCKSDLVSSSQNSGQCWAPSGSNNCDIKSTALAMLALGNLGSSTGSAQTWLQSKNATPTQLEWYLEIESSDATACTIDYGSASYNLNIGSDKKIDTNAGSCLVLSSNRYWLSVSPSCYNTQFSISCDKDFLTTTLFKKTTSSTIHVSDQSSSASAGGTTTEEVRSYCFADSGSCSYEGTLWAALALNKLGQDVSSYLPYLITLADENDRYLPDAFLYALTGKDQYHISLLSEQQSNSYWQASGDKYYDTALALYPLQQSADPQKDGAKTWLLSSQDSAGCWQSNVRDTAFILASVWPKMISTPTSLPDCESAGNYCTSVLGCTGSQLGSYQCPGSLQICCSQPEVTPSCSDQLGVTCNSNQKCIGGTQAGASGLNSGQFCCIDGGYCGNPSTTTQLCESNGGVCRTSCLSNEQENSNYQCDSSTNSCCLPSSTTTTSGGGSKLWIWILIILIILIVVGILFRKKLKLWFHFRHGPKSGGPGPPPPGFFPPAGARPSYPGPIRRVPERRIMLPQPRPQPRQASSASKELDEVLKKLKDMNK